ncbi:hypothetical protein LCGC14_2758360 [marine sediment metagenome]|uniref:Uncharacterized protein n=1 Tax=marine sediment metagenome TaxID=412755 RepID=A0A0F8YZS7_9ZZZZ
MKIKIIEISNKDAHFGSKDTIIGKILEVHSKEQPSAALDYHGPGYSKVGGDLVGCGFEDPYYYFAAIKYKEIKEDEPDNKETNPGGKQIELDYTANSSSADPVGG